MAGTGLKAIETVYNGYRFRSRLEARWAVFFDALGIQYRYEPEGFDLDGLWYLPDFWLPEQEIWIEIKPTAPTEREEELAKRLAFASGHYVFIQYGEIPDRSHDGRDHANPYPAQSAHVWWPDGESWDCDYWWCECPQCSYLGLEYSGRADRLRCGHGSTADKGYNYDSRRLRAAYMAGRGARFEHGETPVPPTPAALTYHAQRLAQWLHAESSCEFDLDLATISQALGIHQRSALRALLCVQRAGYADVQTLTRADGAIRYAITLLPVK